jgi:predicted dehydrogenase
MKHADIRWGIIGAGDVAHAFVNDFKWMKQAQLRAIASSDPGRAEAFAKKYDIPYALSYEELYSHKEIDAIYIATIHHMHFEQALSCMNAGKAVLCEKPVTINDVQFKELATVSKERQVFLMEAIWTYFLPAIIKVKQWINEGLIGEIKVIQADLAYPMDPVTQAKLFDPVMAGGSLVRLGIYPIALTYYLTEREPEHIYSSAQLTKSGVDERLAMTLQYGDITASLFSSIVTRMTNKGRIFGGKGYIEIPDFWRARESKLFDQQFNLVETFQDDRESHGFIYEMQHANGLILAGEYESPIVPHARSYSIQRTMTAIRKQAGVKFPMED